MDGSSTTNETTEHWNQLPIVEITGPEAKKLASLLAVNADLTASARAATRLGRVLEAIEAGGDVDREDLGHLSEALYTAALISYARAFATGRRSGLSEHDFTGADPLALSAHRRFMKIRDQHIAHNVLPFEEVKIGAVLTLPGQGTDEVIGIVEMMIRRQTDAVSGVTNLLILIEMLQTRLSTLIEEQGSRVLDEARALDVRALRGHLPLGYSATDVEPDNRPPL